MRSYLKALIFDLDGTLADTIPAISEAVNMTLVHLGMPERDESEIRTFIGRGPRYLIEQSLPAGERTPERVSAALAVYDGMYAKTYMHTRRLYDGMSEVISELAKYYKIAILSNKQEEYVRALADLLLPEGCHAAVRGSRAGVPAKPTPDAALELAQELGVAPHDCILIGDSEIDILTAENAEFDILSVSWGYSTKLRLLQKGAQEIVATPDELLEYFK